MDYVEKQNISPPPELAAGFMVERWGINTVFGTTDVPAHTLYCMAASLNVHAAWRSYQAGNVNLVKWATANPQYFNIVANIRALRP